MRPTIALNCIAGLAVCVTSSAYSQMEDWQRRMIEDAKKPAVVAQFCVTATKEPGYLNLMDIKKTGSAGGTTTHHVGTTQSGQLIFQSFHGRTNEFRAVIVFPLTSTQQAFFARRSYPKGMWSAWQAPDQVSGDEDLWYKLVNGRKPGKGTASPVTAYARFKQSSYVEFRDELDKMGSKGLESNMPSCPPISTNPSLQSGPAGAGRPAELRR